MGSLYLERPTLPDRQHHSMPPYLHLLPLGQQYIRPLPGLQGPECKSWTSFRLLETIIVSNYRQSPDESLRPPRGVILSVLGSV